ISDKEHKKRLKLYKQGYNDKKISEILEVSSRVIYYWRKKHSLSHNYKPEYKSIVDKKHDEIKYYYDQGLTDHEIANKLGCSKSIIRKWRRKNNKIFNKKTIISEKNNKILKYYNQGLNDTEIADKIGCSFSTIRRWRKKNKMPKNNN
ncbi:MAG: helix-turn-helix domain-containing protein, partial [bacterium]